MLRNRHISNMLKKMNGELSRRSWDREDAPYPEALLQPPPPETNAELRARCVMKDLLCPTATHVACVVCGAVGHAGTGMFAAFFDVELHPARGLVEHDPTTVCWGKCYLDYIIAKKTKTSTPTIKDPMTPPNHPNPHIAHLSTEGVLLAPRGLNADPFVPESVREAAYILGYTLSKLHAAPPRDLSAPPSLPDLVRMLLGALVERLSPDIAASLGAHNIPAYDADLGIVVAQVEVARTEAQRALEHEKRSLEKSEARVKELETIVTSYSNLEKARLDKIAALHKELAVLRNKARRTRKIEQGAFALGVDPKAKLGKARKGAEGTNKKEGRR